MSGGYFAPTYWPRSYFPGQYFPPMVDELVAAPVEQQIGGALGTGKAAKKKRGEQERKPISITAPPAEFLRIPTLPTTNTQHTFAQPLPPLPIPTTEDLSRLEDELALLLALELV